MINYKLKKEKLKTKLQKFKGFWHKLMKHYQNRIGFDKDEKYKYVSATQVRDKIKQNLDYTNLLEPHVYKYLNENKEILNRRLYAN